MASVRVLALLVAMAGTLARAHAADTCRASAGDPLHTQRLRRALLCAYDPAAGPTEVPGTRSVVRLSLLRSRFDMNEVTNTLTMFGYLVMVWKDERLDWDRDAYPNVTRVFVDASEIWTPSIALVENPSTLLEGKQALVLNGTVVYNLLVPLETPCLNDASRWPFDRVVCNMSIANLSPDTAKIDNSTFKISVVRTRTQGWSMTGFMLKPSFKSFAFEDGLLVQVWAERREAGLAVATAVVPCALLAVLALASLWLPAHAPHRPLLLCAVILLQILMSVVVPMRILVESSRPPGVMLLLRDGLFVSGAALLQWLLSRWLVLRPRSATGWPWPLGLLADGGPRLAAALCLPPPEHALDAPDAKAARVSAVADRAAFLVLTLVCASLSARLLP